MDINGNLSLDDAEVREVLKVHAYTVGATAAYSDQFPGEVANSVPGDAGFDDSGKPKKYILMAAAKNGVANARADVNIAGTPPTNLIFGFAEPLNPTWTSPGTPAGAGISTISVSSYALASPTALAQMQISYGVDANGDGSLQSTEVVGWIPYHFQVASPQRVVAATATLDTLAHDWTHEFGASIASNWLHSFLKDVGLAGATNAPSAISTADTRYNHHVGAIFAGQIAPVNKAIFGPTSHVALDIYHSYALIQDIRNAINGRAIAALLGDSGEWKHFDLSFDELPINFSEDLDLHYAIGHATLSSVHISYFAKIEGDRLRIRPTVTAVLTDLYDFDLDAGGFSVPAAITEAGYSGAGSPGHVFVEEVHLADELPESSVEIA